MGMREKACRLIVRSGMVTCDGEFGDGVEMRMDTSSFRDRSMGYVWVMCRSRHSNRESKDDPSSRHSRLLSI